MTDHLIEDVKKIITDFNAVFDSEPYNVDFSETTKMSVRQFLHDLEHATKKDSFTRAELAKLLCSLNVQYTFSCPDFPTKYPKLDRHMSGNTGEFFVCAELGRRNILGLLAPKNNPLYDIVATNQVGTHTVHIQVKTSQQHVYAWSLARNMVQLKGNNKLFVVLVKLMDTGISYYIWKYDDLAIKLQSMYSTNPTKETLTLHAKDFTHDELLKTIDNWDSLGF